nr:GPI mannosyltransferase 3-like [Lytechinus pictus]
MAYNLRPRSGVQVETLGPMDREESAKTSVKEKKAWSDPSLLILLVLFRWLNAGLVQTSFVPDEYWQSLEVAHKVVFGNGYLTWEWRTGLRGYAYPTIFVILYKILAILKLDYPVVLILAPCVLQATLSAIGDFCLYKTSVILHGKDVARWTLLMNLSSWFVFYNATRTLTNTMESILTSVGLFFFPWPRDWLHDDNEKQERNPQVYIMVVALACLVRPTAAILWFPLCLWHINFSRVSMDSLGFTSFHLISIIVAALEFIRVALTLFLPVGLVTISASLLLDRLFYGNFVFVQKNFMEFNFLHDLGAFYGTHPWHWYFSQGFPVVIATHIPSFLLGAKIGYKKNSLLLWAVFWTMCIYSFTSHKEFRFILPIVPICMLFCGLFMDDMYRRGKSKLLVLYLLFNVPAIIYFGLVHQRGVLDVMGYVREVAEDYSTGQQRSVMFLMPCHSTPFYSHVHTNLPMRFLECPPNLNQEEDYVEESSLFYNNPMEWLRKEYEDPTSVPTHLIFFDVLRTSIEDFLSLHHFQEVASYFHTHLPEGRMGSRVLVFAREEGQSLPER